MVCRVSVKSEIIKNIYKTLKTKTKRKREEKGREEKRRENHQLACSFSVKAFTYFHTFNPC